MKAFALAAAAALMVGQVEAKVVQINGFVASNSVTGDKFVFLKDTWALWLGDKVYARSGISPNFHASEIEYNSMENELRFFYDDFSGPDFGVDFWIEAYPLQKSDGAGERFFFPTDDFTGGVLSEAFPNGYGSHLTLLLDGKEIFITGLNRLDIAAVPLPAAAPILLTGAAALFAIRAKRSRRQASQ